jgi:hypothetical protein
MQGRSQAAKVSSGAGPARREAQRPGPVNRWSAALLTAGHPSADAMRAVQRSAGNVAGNATAAASKAALPIQRTSAYHATSSRESQVLARNLRQRYGLSSRPRDVTHGEVLWIIGHASEIGSGTGVANEVLARGFRPGGGRQVRLVVCKAGQRASDAHAAPAQNIANILRTTVQGSTTLVLHATGSNGRRGLDIIEGNFHSFAPQSRMEDITSRMGHLSVRDAEPMDDLTAQMGNLNMNPNGWTTYNGGAGFGGPSSSSGSSRRRGRHSSSGRSRGHSPMDWEPSYY